MDGGGVHTHHTETRDSLAEFLFGLKARTTTLTPVFLCCRQNKTDCISLRTSPPTRAGTIRLRLRPPGGGVPPTHLSKGPLGGGGAKSGQTRVVIHQTRVVIQSPRPNHAQSRSSHAQSRQQKAQSTQLQGMDFFGPLLCWLRLNIGHFWLLLVDF